MPRNIPINKGNYSLDTPERETEFTRRRSFGVEEEYARNRTEWEAFPRTGQVAEYPLLVDLELSSLCNLKCPFCYTITDNFKERVQATLMDFSLFTRIIDEIAGKVFAIRLSLRGEPMIHPRFADAVRYAKEKGIGEISTLTNGSRLTPECFTEIMDAGLDWITVSFDGLHDEYERNRFPLKFEEMYHRLEEAGAIKRRAGQVKPVIKIQTVWPAIENNPAEFLDTMTKVSDLVAFNPIIDFDHPRPYESIEFEKGFSCPQLYQRLVVGADGLVMMCSNDEESESIVGNACEESIQAIWHGPKLTDARNIHRQNEGFRQIGICRKCYLPRKTREDRFDVNGRVLVVRNYV